MSTGEADCTGTGGSGFILEPPLSNLITKNNNNTKINNNNNEDTDCSLEKSVCGSSNATSATAAAATTTTENFLNGTTNLDTKILLKCDRCDSFETISHALLLVHLAKCNADAPASGNSSSSRLAATAAAATGDPGGDSATESDQMQHQAMEASTSAPLSTTMVTATAVSATKGDPDTPCAPQRKLFECDVCNMKFSNGANMRRHKMRHTGVKPYECRVCQKRFFRKDHLAEHFTTHTKTLPYHCPICNRGFQRQIAMRAHFQNEHVGQHDLVKTCPLCSYRAGTMKSLRIHFFNRHGIDLDNPGPNAPSSLLLALDPMNASNYLPSIALAAAAAAVNAGNNAALGVSGNSNGGGPAYSDSGESLRSADNGTPPMHFLTPHVEISMADNDSFKSEPIPANVSSALEIQPCPSSMSLIRPSNGGSPSPHSADSNSNAPTSSQSLIGSVLQHPRHLLTDGQITPSISLIPIKQEPSNDEYMESSLSKSLRQSSDSQGAQSMNVSTNSVESAAPSSSNLTLIKVSPLKSLLREDLKRRISARASSRATRNSNNANASSNASSPPANQTTSSSSGIGGSNSSNTSSSSSNASSAGNSASHNANSGGPTGPNHHHHHHHLLSNSSITVTTETSPASSSAVAASAAAVATTSNGAITSTGADTELQMNTGIGHHRSKRMLQCLFCGIEFPDQTLYFLHKGCHSESNPWKCNICGEQCNNVYEFNSHLLSKSHQ